jgi:hypothetical protein
VIVVLWLLLRAVLVGESTTGNADLSIADRSAGLPVVDRAVHHSRHDGCSITVAQRGPRSTHWRDIKTAIGPDFHAKTLPGHDRCQRRSPGLIDYRRGDDTVHAVSDRYAPLRECRKGGDDSLDRCILPRDRDPR